MNKYSSLYKSTIKSPEVAQVMVISQPDIEDDVIDRISNSTTPTPTPTPPQFEEQLDELRLAITNESRIFLFKFNISEI